MVCPMCRGVFLKDWTRVFFEDRPVYFEGDENGGRYVTISWGEIREVAASLGEAIIADDLCPSCDEHVSCPLCGERYGHHTETCETRD